MNNKVEVDFGGWIEKGFALWKQDIVTLAVVALVVFFVSALSLLILTGPMMVGMFMIIFALHDKTQPKPQIGDVFKGFDFFGPSVVLFLILFGLGLATSVFNFIPHIGRFIGILASLCIQTAIMFAWPFLVDKKMAPVDAVKASFEIVKDNFFPFLGLNLVAGIIGSVGIIACCIGIFVTMPIAFCIIVVAYRAISSAQTSALAAPTETPPPSPPPPSA
jgi:uncharacterized membrane protein